MRHKILDLIGDFSLIGHIVAHKSGYALNAQMVSRLLDSPQNWSIIGSEEESKIARPEMQYQPAML